MLRTILLDLNGTDHGRGAVDLAICWAKRFEALLIGIGVVDEPAIRGPYEHVGHSSEAAFDRLVADATRHVESVLEEFSIRCSDEQVAFKLLENIGHPDEQIIREAARYDLVMLGQKNESHRRAGKTLELVLRHCPRPVVVVPDEACHGEGVLVAYDDSLQAARTLQAFVASGLSALGDVRVVTVHPESSVQAAKTADRAIEFLGFHGVRATAVPVVSHDPPGAVVINEAKSRAVALMVMGAYGQPRLKEMLVGSTTRSALDTCPVPMFLDH